MTDKCGIARPEREDCRPVIAARVFEQGHEQQRARVVVEAAIVMRGMLKMAC
jgi:hypothetical protein